MRRIWKFDVKIPFEGNIFSVEMPEGAEVLDVQIQQGSPQIWALVDPDAPSAERLFRLYGTGNPINEKPGRYLGSFQMAEGALVFHVFEEVSE